MSEGLIILYAVIVWTAVITAIALGLRWWKGSPEPTDVALEAPQARYARAEMDPREYERRRRDHGAGRP